MLRLEDIKKNYYVADMTVEALKGINLCFRKSEFVSILGPSGCGKTTLLNIIGGLDQYTSGDLVIAGRSTKEFKDHDWDVYRNHRIGFIFQSYNLIPHQTVLGNVELALTIAGLPKEERIKRAKKALDRVGLSNQYYKRPNQMSGGQCQRVAIARALVNEPEILLADEPTGALDTETSIQIMELIKEIAKERLVIMVTHNPDLAYQYSTRIVKCLDGNVLEDSMPFDREDEIKEMNEIMAQKLKEEEEETRDLSPAELKKKRLVTERAKMSLWTAFKLSSRNLHSKFKRTFMVALAGCIGIVGVSTVLAVSNGVQNYIETMENDMLSGNPVTISSSSLDYSSLMGGGLNNGQENVNEDNDKTKIFINSLIRTLYNMNGVTSKNEITQAYMDFLEEMPEEACALVKYDYGYKIAPNIYTDFATSDGKTHTMSVAAIQATYASVLNNVKEFTDYSSMISSVTVMSEAPSDAKYLASQYDIVYIQDGLTLEDVIKDKTSLIAVASQKQNTLNDLELAEYGYFSQERFLNYCYKIGNSDLYVDNSILNLPETISYEDLCSKKFTWYPNNTVYKKGTSNDDDLGDKYYASAYSDGTLANETDPKYDNYKRDAFGTVDAQVDLNVKCVLKLKEDASYGCLSSGGLYYTEALSSHMRDYNLGSDVVESAKKNGALYNIELGYNFRFDGKETKSHLETYKLTTDSSIMSFISQLMNMSGGSNDKVSMASYTLEALGGSEFPTNISFYCNDFEQKDLLTAYLDKWNTDNAKNLYKKDEHGFYLGTVKDNDGKDVTTHYYYDDESDKFYSVEISDSGYALDYKGNQYKLETENNRSSFYKKLSDNTHEDKKFKIDGTIEITSNYSINVMSLANYVLFGDEFDSSNLYWNEKTEVGTSGYLYTYLNSDGENEYIMKVPNQNYHKLSLDKDGNIVALENGYQKYRYDQETKKFYKDTYVKHDDAGVITYTVESLEVVESNKYDNMTGNYYIEGEIDPITNKPTKIIVAQETLSTLYADDKVYSYPNVVVNPLYTIAGTKYKLNTFGLAVDMSTLSNNLSFNDIGSTQDDPNDPDVKIITLRDYSSIDFYLLDEKDTGYTYYYVDYQIRNINGEDKACLIGKDISAFLSSAGIGEGIGEDYLSELYIIDEDGSLHAVTESFQDAPLTVGQMIELKVIGEELTDLSILQVDDSLKIEYTDMIGIIISMVNTLIQVITYALIAFTALSLVVSTVMIGIITYVSVVERTKEIGVIRALGGRKKDVSHLFNAETLIIGFSAGVLGIAITYLLSLVINLIIGHYSGIYTIAALPWYQAIIMIMISIFLTLISGLIPASSAAKKDPVIALRTE